MKFDFSPYTGIKASEKEASKDPQERVEDQCDAIEADFDFALAGIEKLARDGEYEAASDAANKIHAVLNEVIADIGDNFTNAQGV